MEKQRALIEPEHKDLSQRRQCQLLGINRSGLYYKPREVSTEMLRLMRAIDEEYLETLIMEEGA